MGAEGLKTLPPFEKQKKYIAAKYVLQCFAGKGRRCAWTVMRKSEPLPS